MEILRKYSVLIKNLESDTFIPSVDVFINLLPEDIQEFMDTGIFLLNNPSSQPKAEDISIYFKFLTFLDCPEKMIEFEHFIDNWEKPNDFLNPQCFLSLFCCFRKRIVKILNRITVDELKNKGTDLEDFLCTQESYISVEALMLLQKYNGDKLIDIHSVCLEPYKNTPVTHRPKCVLKNTINSNSRFKQRLYEVSCGMIDDDFPWDGVCIAGGAVVHCLMDTPWLPSSDIDLWIYGENSKEHFQNVIKHFSDRESFYAVNRSLITIANPKWDVNFQVIFVNDRKRDEIVKDFDFSYVKLLYDGTKVYASPDAIFSVIHKTSTYTNLPIGHRLIKCLEKGFSLNLDESIDLEKYQLKYEESIEKYYFPSTSLSESRNQHIMKLIFRCPVCLTMDEALDNFKYQGFDRKNPYVSISPENLPCIVDNDQCNLVDVEHDYTYIKRNIKNSKVLPYKLNNKWVIPLENVKLFYHFEDETPKGMSVYLSDEHFSSIFREYLLSLFDKLKSELPHKKDNSFHGIKATERGMYINVRISDHTKYFNTEKDQMVDSLIDLNVNRDRLMKIVLEITEVKAFILHNYESNPFSWSFKPIIKYLSPMPSTDPFFE